MSSSRTTVMLVAPGRRTVSLEFGPRWPAAMIGVLCMPLLLGAAARRCADTWHGDGHGPLCRIAASDMTGSLSAATRPTPPVARALPRSRRNTARAMAAAPMLTAIAAAYPAPVERLAPSRVRPARPAPPIDGAAPGWLRLQALHLGESVRVRPFDAAGVADPAAFGALSHLMRCRITGREIEIDRGLVRVLAQLGAAYDRPIQLVSGHRQPHVIGTSSTSQHTLGRAADIRVAGVSVEELRATAIEFGARGVGIYPEKGFVHVDMRDKHKYFWTYTAADGEVQDQLH